MGFRGVVIVGLLGVLCLAAPFFPFAGIAAYLLNYHIYPEKTWWGKVLADNGARISLTITAFLVIGTLVHWNTLRYRRLLSGQEILFFCLLGWLLLGRLIFGAPDESLGGTDPFEKMLKMSVFMFILTHVVVTKALFNRLYQVFLCCALYLGYEAFTAPPSAFFQGRLDGYVGGPDFLDSNALAAHVLFLTVVSGVQLLRTSSWMGRLVGVAAGALCANTIIMTRSRGAFIAGAVGVLFAVVWAPKGKRGWVWALIACGLVGAFSLVDSNYLLRLGTIEVKEQQSEQSAQSRIDMWKVALRMISDHPLGVGPGNFASRVGSYDLSFTGRDTHNTYLRCLAELGWPGFLLFLALIVSPIRRLLRIIKVCGARVELAECRWAAYALLIGVVPYLVASTFVTLLYTEMMWLLLLLPEGLQRAVENAQEDAAADGKTSDQGTDLDRVFPCGQEGAAVDPTGEGGHTVAVPMS